MATDRELLQALLEGKDVLIKAGDGKAKYHMRGDTVIFTNSEGVEMINKSHRYVYLDESYEIKDQPQWHDNIPEGGVLCNVWDFENQNRLITNIIAYKSSSSDFQYQSESSVWNNAVPLTKAKIQKFLDNAPE